MQVQVGRLIGVTLAIVEAGRLAASFLVNREVKHSVKHFHVVRETAYHRVEARNLQEAHKTATQPCAHCAAPAGLNGGTVLRRV